MPVDQIVIQNTGLVSSIGLTTPTTCAALRASVTNPTPSRFMGVDGEWIMAHQVALPSSAHGLDRLVQMAALAIIECLEPLPASGQRGVPLLLCVAERERPGRLEGLDDRLFTDLEKHLGINFHPTHSAIVSMGRPSALMALIQARRLIHEQGVPHVLVAATDSMLVWPTLVAYGDRSRLLAQHNSNGFMPGEAAGALLVGRPSHAPGELQCVGMGLGLEPAPLSSGEPMRAEGLTAAIKQALQEAECEMHETDFRITDLSGEQYFFKEAALALARSMRKTKPEFDLWHPAEGIGEVGAAAGTAMIANAFMACRKGYAKGPRILLHAGNDAERRAAAILSWTGDLK